MNWKKWNPLNWLPDGNEDSPSLLSSEVDGLLHGWLRGMGWPTLAPGFAGDTGASMPRLLRRGVELAETPGTYEFRIAAPGLEWEDLKLRVEDDKLVVHGARQGTAEAENGYRFFSRAIPLPRDAAGEILSATLQNGRLTVTLPRGHDGALVKV